MKKVTCAVLMSVILLAFTMSGAATAYASAGAAAPPPPPDPDETYRVEAAGASFPFPLIDRWRVEIKEDYPNVNLNYQSIGSGGGVKNHLESTIVFAGTDAPMTKRELKLADPTLHIPETIGAINIVYNLPGYGPGLKLTGQAVADIYLGKITTWNHPDITRVNPGLILPDETIQVIHRSDGSGTTKVFTQWLSSASEEWDRDIGAGKSVPWPKGVGAPGNEGVAGTMLSTPYSVGYVSIAYASQLNMHSAALENGDGSNFVLPTLESTARAAGNMAQQSLPPVHEPWTDVSLLNAPGADSYPLASFTYLLVYEDVTDVVDSRSEAEGLVWMLHWMVTEGQQYSAELGFVPLPDEVVELVKQGLGRVMYDGDLVWEYTPVSDDVDVDLSDDPVVPVREALIPPWIKDLFGFYVEGSIGDVEIITALQYLIQEGIIIIIPAE